MGIESAAERRRQQNAALVAGHPRWRGIQHPELIPFPPRRYSARDVLPAVERARAWPAHARRTRDIVAAHPRWHGIRHPERIVFPDLPRRDGTVLAYRAALRVALSDLRDSEQLARKVAGVAAAIGRRSWPWAASPALATPRVSPEARPRSTPAPRPGPRARWDRPAAPPRPRRPRPGRPAPRRGSALGSALR